MGSLLKFYKHLLNRYPFSSQAIQTGILMGCGDLIAQTAVEKQPLQSVDAKRTGQFITVGTLLVGPTLTIWYRMLAKYVGHGGKNTVLKKVALDQLLFAPICLGVFLSSISFVQGNSIEETKRHVKHNYYDILTTNYKIWPMVQMGNFYLVPLQYQVLVVQIVALFWNAYLSFKTRPNQTSDW